MTVAQARRALRPLKLLRTSDGEGIALIGAMRGRETVMTLYAGEPDPARRIDELATIKLIEVWDPSYTTSAGVHPGMALNAVEGKYGNLTEITISEIESREYASFKNLPAGITLRVGAGGSTAGVYPAGRRTTQRYNSSARIVSVTAAGAPKHTVANSLCGAGERVLFSAFVEGSTKLVSVCSSKVLDDRRGYLQYRFGRPGKIELQFPSGTRNTQKAFTYTRYTRPLVTYLTLTFTTNKFRYSIHQDDDSETSQASNSAYITIAPLPQKTDGPVGTTIRLGGRVTGTLMSLENVVINRPWTND
jgi:YD repeat-containing protein